MNQHLQKILNFIQQSKELNSNEKADILKTVDEADKEIELKDRDLKIEPSLERVRAVALSMKKPGDLLNVCEILFTELLALGFNELRNVMINIYNDDNVSFLNYDYSDVIYKSVTHLFYNTNPLIESRVKQMRTASGAFSETVFKGKDLQEWKEFRKEKGEKDDPRLTNITALYYYFYSIGIGSIGISTFNSITEEKRNVLKRFRNVFDLAYRRYMDVVQAEAQAKEAKIEVSLERVRTVALGMNKPDDMLLVCRIISEQLAQLDVKEIRNVQTAIFYEEKGVYINYEFYAKHDKTLITEVSYKGNQLHQEFANQMLKGSGEIFTHSLFDKEVRDWLEYQKTTNVFIDSYLENAPSLNYYWYSLGPVALGISTYAPLSEEETNLFKRFRNVFELSYRRYIDIELALAQAREAKIEVALERVRARTMAMQKSDELLETSSLLFKQFEELGEVAEQFSIGILNEDERVFEISATLRGSQFQRMYKSSIDEPYVIKKIFTAYKALQKSFVLEMTGQEFREYNAYRNQLSSGEVEFNRSEKLEERWIINVAFFSKGLLSVSGDKPKPKETLQLLERFAKVFDLTYTRFLDLKQAEEQAREVQIEASLERVRSNAMAMHSSEDLSTTVNVFFKELKKLGVLPWRCGVGQIDEKTRTTKLTTTSVTNQGDSYEVSGSLKQEGYPVLDGIYEHWKIQKEYYPILKGEDIKAYYEIIKPQIAYPDYPLDAVQYGHMIFFKEGFVFAWTENKLTEKELSIFRRFTSVLSLTYRRYLDLKEAEAQAREAQIEGGLERVRSKTLAMHSSDELAGTAAVLFKQLINLGIEPNRLYICIIKDETGNAEFWITDEDGSKVSSKFTARLNDNLTFKKMFDGWKKQQKSIVIDLHGKELEEYFHHLGDLHVPFKGGLSQTRRVQNISYFSRGFIGIASPDLQPEETVILLERFAGVFNITYTRFNDLQLAEAQSRKAQIETAMERVRGRALAMQEPEELLDVAHVLRHEMGLLGVEEIETGTVFIFDDATDTAQFGFTAKDVFYPERPVVTDTITLDLKQTWAGSELLKFFKSEKTQTSVRMEGTQRREWLEYVYSLSPKANNFFGENIQDKTYHMYKFSNGAVGAASTDEISEETWDLLKRASSVFSLAYSRFKDLTKARFDLLLLKEEKKRSDSLLLNILPEEIANELKQFGKSYARKHEQVTILFADIKGFSSIAEHLSAEELVTQLDECFRAFDKIIEKHGLEKIKTVGDAYICACGLPKPVNDNAIKTVRAAIDMLDFLKGFGISKKIQDLPAFEFRIGVHTGPVVTGVVGLKKFTYDIWGDAVNMAARMEQNGEAGRINVSENTYELIKDKFNCTPRGKIPAKNKGEIDMYFVNE